MRVLPRAFAIGLESIGGTAAAPPRAAANRDMRFDAIRGLFLISMTAVHIPTPVSHFLHEPLGFISDAEGFIFLSACLAGLIYGKTYQQTEWSTMSRRVWQRARKIYLIHLAVILPVVSVAWAFADRITPLANHFHDFLVHPWGSLALIPLLLHQPPLFDILPLYVILLSVTPLLFAIARRHGWGILLAVSFLVWLAQQFNLDAHFMGSPTDFLPLRWGSFDLLAWQLVWVSGLALGETAFRRPIVSGKWRFGLTAISAPIVLAGLLARHGLFPAEVHSEQRPAQATDRQHQDDYPSHPIVIKPPVPAVIKDDIFRNYDWVVCHEFITGGKAIGVPNRATRLLP